MEEKIHLLHPYQHLCIITKPFHSYGRFCLVPRLLIKLQSCGAKSDAGFFFHWIRLLRQLICFRDLVIRYCIGNFEMHVKKIQFPQNYNYLNHELQMKSNFMISEICVQVNHFVSWNASSIGHCACFIAQLKMLSHPTR